jgi:hypothetical protein
VGARTWVRETTNQSVRNLTRGRTPWSGGGRHSDPSILVGRVNAKRAPRGEFWSAHNLKDGAAAQSKVVAMIRPSPESICVLFEAVVSDTSGVLLYSGFDRRCSTSRSISADGSDRSLECCDFVGSAKADRLGTQRTGMIQSRMRIAAHQLAAAFGPLWDA